jgi:hypothetical protein
MARHAWERRADMRWPGARRMPRKAYEKFFALWQDADRDLPILINAKSEYQKLN